METAGEKKRRKGRTGSKRDKEPKPFEGVTQRPVCEICVAEAEKLERETKREPPPKVERVLGRRPEVDTGKQFCPYQRGRYYGWLGRGNISAHGHPSGGEWRQLKCVVCGKHVQETIGTVFYGSRVPALDIMRAIASLCEGVSPWKMARIFGVDKDSVLSWLAQAAEHSPHSIII